jgi:hypothetical protein
MFFPVSIYASQYVTAQYNYCVRIASFAILAVDCLARLSSAYGRELVLRATIVRAVPSTLDRNMQLTLLSVWLHHPYLDAPVGVAFDALKLALK